MAIKGKKQQVLDLTWWDKLKRWRHLKEEIERYLSDSDNSERSIALYHGLQLLNTLRHSSRIRAMAHFSSKTGELFMTHYRAGADNVNCAWTANNQGTDIKLSCKRFETKSMIAKLIFIPEHRMYIAFLSDLRLQVFTDSKMNCQERSTTMCITTILCMEYNKETDELIAGGIGQILRWSLHGIERGDPPKPGRKFETSITRDDWVIQVMVDNKSKHILALCGFHICVVNYETDKQVHFIDSRHVGALSCCTFYNMREYFITAGRDGCIKVWNTATLHQVHEFVGHFAMVTGLQVHKSDPLLLSSSLDGTVQVWRMDNFQWLKRLDVGEKIFSMKLLGKESLFCQTVNDILLYNLNQFYNLFSPVESSVYSLHRMSWPGHQSVIMVSTEDGSVRIISPVTGLTVTMIYPLPTFQVLSLCAYNRQKNQLFTLLSSGEVLIFDCSSNPCITTELRVTDTPDEQILCITLISVFNQSKQCTDDMLIFGGRTNGQLTLVDSDHHVLSKPVKAHDGSVICLESVQTTCDCTSNSVGKLISVGSEFSIRITDVIKLKNLLSFVQILSIRYQSSPVYVSMTGNVLCAVLEPRWVSMVKLDLGVRGIKMDAKDVKLSHSVDDDHTEEVTGLDHCESLGLFATSAMDGYIKIWNNENTLIKELHFGNTLRGVCFANLRGDILVGFERHVCSVSISQYLPYSLLEFVIREEFKDDEREDPLPYNHKLKLWFEPKKLPTFSIDPERRKQQLKCCDLNVVKSEDSFEVIENSRKFVDNYAARCLNHLESEIDSRADPGRQNRSTSLTPTENFCLQRFVTLARLKRKELKIREFNKTKTANRLSGSWQRALEAHTNWTKIRLDMVAKKEQSRSKQIIESSANEVHTANEFEYDPEDGDHGTNAQPPPSKWIIAPDGYIPNSVIRKRLGIKWTHVEPKKYEPWKVKPVGPLAALSDDWFSPEGSIFKTSRPGTGFSWGGDEEVVKQEEKAPNETEVRESSTSPGGSRKWRERESKLGNKVLADYQSRRTFHPKEPTVEDALYEQPARAHREPVTYIEEMEVPDVFRRLLEEQWFPAGVDLNLDNIIGTLLKIMGTCNPIINRYVLEYVVEISRDMGIPARFEIDLLKTLLVQLAHPDPRIQQGSIWTLGELGLSDREVIIAMLPKLVDSNTDVRDEATSAIQKILGVDNKEDLLRLLDEMGLAKKYDEMELTEDEIFHQLQKETGGVVDENVFDRIQGWVNISSPEHPWDDEQTTKSVVPGKNGKNKTGLGSSGAATPKSSIATPFAMETGYRRSTPDDQILLGTPESAARRGVTDAASRRTSLAPGTRRGSQVAGTRETVTDLGAPRREGFGAGTRRPSLATAGGQSSDHTDMQDQPDRTSAGSDQSHDSSVSLHLPTGTNEGSPTINLPSPLNEDITDGRSSIVSIESHDAVALKTDGHGHGHGYVSGLPKKRQGLHGFGRKGDENGLWNRSDWSDRRSETGSVSSAKSGGSDITKRFNPKMPHFYRYFESVKDKKGVHKSVLGVPGVDSTQSWDDADSAIYAVKDSLAGDSDTWDSHSQKLSGIDQISTYDSGIGHDLSDSSSHHGSHHGSRFAGTLVERGFPCLSPVKSLAEMGENSFAESGCGSNEWRQFFNRPSAQERKRMELVKKDFSEGKTKPITVCLPPIPYIKENTALCHGETGLRLLTTVKVGGDKGTSEGSNGHRIEAIPGKMTIHTKSERQGSSQFGILQMQWTTGIPVSNSQNGVTGTQVLTDTSRILSQLPPMDDSLIGRLEGKSVFSKPDAAPSRQVAQSGDFQWDTPLPPPPPPRESRLHIPSARRNHEHYCKYYSLVKRKMHLYTSKLLPPVWKRHPSSQSRFPWLPKSHLPDPPPQRTTVGPGLSALNWGDHQSIRILPGIDMTGLQEFSSA